MWESHDEFKAQIDQHWQGPLGHFGCEFEGEVELFLILFNQLEQENIWQCSSRDKETEKGTGKAL